MLRSSYGLGRSFSLVRLRPDLVDELTSAFAAAEADLRQWMPSSAKEQENATEFVDWCVDAFDTGKTFAYAVTTREGALVGYANLTPQRDHALVAYWIHPHWRGQGIAPRAVRVLSAAAFDVLPHVERVHAHLDAANTASRRVLEKAGFHHHESYIRPPRTPSETDTEWLYVRPRST